MEILELEIGEEAGAQLPSNFRLGRDMGRLKLRKGTSHDKALRLASWWTFASRQSTNSPFIQI